MTGFNLSAFAVRERAITLFMIIAIMLAGAYAFLHLGRAEDPKFTVKTMTVTAIWPGATAKEMQEQVADRLEKRLQELKFYDRVETAASPGMILMKLYLKDATAPKDVPDEFYQARKKLSDEKIHLPQGVIGPLMNDEFSDVYFAMYSVEAKGLPHRSLVLEAEALRQRFSRIDGVEKVTILGEQDPKIYVEISYKRLATLGVKATDLFRALQTQNDVTPSGFVDTAGPRVYLRLDGAINGIETVKAIPVASGGKLLKIGDVAEVIRGYEDPATKQIRNQGEPALILALVMKKGFNGLTLGKLLKAEETAIRKELPVGLTLSKVSDQSHVISEAIGEFMLKFVVALAVVIVVSLATLGFRVGIVVAAAVPLTLAAVFVIMLITGRYFDRITLGALIISLGLLVDDAIIAIEMMVVKMEEGFDRIQAATFAWTSTAGPMLSGTLVTIVGFLPVGFAKSTAGEYAGNIFWVVAFALITSWFVAVLFTPYLGVKLLPDITPVSGGHDAIYATPNYQRFRAMVRQVVDHKWLAAGVTIALFTLSVVGMKFVEKQFFPNSDRPELTVEVNLPPGSAFAATDRTVKNIEKTIMAEPEASLVTSYIGQGMPRFILPTNPELPNPAYAQIVILTKGSAARNALKKKLRNQIAQGAFPEARVRVKQFVFGPPVPFPVLFRVMGPDPNELRRIAREARAIMLENPNLRDLHLDWGELTPSQRLVLDQDRLRLLGLTPQETGLQLQAILNGAPTTQMRDGIRSVDLVVRAPGSERHSLENLGNVSLTTTDGRSIPLSQLAHFESRMEDPLLKRYNREPYISVQGDVVDGVQPPDVTAQILPKLEKLKAALPAGYRIETGGSVEESKKADTALGKLFPLMVLLMLVIIMVQVRSFAAMFLVFATAPLGLVGAVPTMLIFHQPFGFNAILGLIGLAGIIMRNTLILVDQIKQDQKAGLADYDAIVESTVRRARPVVLTAVAAMLAFIPLTFSSFWGSMAYVLIGGVGVGTILTLLFLPALYAIWFKVKRPQSVTEGEARP
ncbi:Multidrug efflux pump subunit AcrB [Trichlorobacter thiogenes]|uniref:Multidrug efflux pump subunit AcrB n=1 Tax=Trichlorobacter thiogenes TaxID=115783 RepID=A0A1T4KDC6_9BACT|nr:efflux RND transporter permease subunit [Trichlorobacter thiogenes]SJZ40419.1 Multidrug efflux pump subunit AcrB [Trichlorobacter thiogenes]